MRYFRDDEVSSLAEIRRKVQFLFQTNPQVHVNVRMRYPRTARQTLMNIPVVIKGVFPNVFQVEDNSSGKPRIYLHQYNEIATKEIEILELNEPATANT